MAADVEFLYNTVVPQSLSHLVPTASSTLATIIIGFTVATTLYGISVLQTYYYFVHFWADSWGLKSFVAFLWTLDTLTTAFVAHLLYYYTVLNYGNPVVGSTIPWTMGAQSAATDLITFLAHLYYIVQIWNASRNKLITGLIVFLSIGALAGDAAVTGLPLLEGVIEAVGEPRTQIVGIFAQSFCVLCDTVITITLIHYFRVWSRETFVSWTIKTLNSLIIYAVSRGVATAAGQLLFLSAYVAYPHRTYWLPFNLVVAKLYVNSVLSSLNARKRFEKEPLVVFMDDLSLAIRPGPVGTIDSLFADTEAQNHHIRFSGTSRVATSDTHASLDTKGDLTFQGMSEDGITTPEPALTSAATSTSSRLPTPVNPPEPDRTGYS